MPVPGHGEIGGQCAAYVRDYFGKTASGLNAVDFWTVAGDANDTRLSRTANNGQTISPPCIAVWDGDSSNRYYGHVGVVQSKNSSPSPVASYKYSDSNRRNDEKVIVDSSLTEAGIKSVVSATFLGYVKYN